MEKSVVGIAGAVRIKQLTIAGLTRAEQHGKRLDATGRERAINDLPPMTTSGLDLGRLYQEHIAGAFVPKAKSKAMHMIVQFPTELVDGAAADRMLGHARQFAATIFGDEAVFADRVDRDEKSQHVVDIFLAPRYQKITKNASKPAVSVTRHLKVLAEAYGHPPIPAGIGRALQDAWFEYLRDNMGLSKVQRGLTKPHAGTDWKSAEQLRCEELDRLEERAAREIEFGFEAGRQVGIERSQTENRHMRAELVQWEERLADRAREQDCIQTSLDESQQQILVLQQQAEEEAMELCQAADVEYREAQASANREAQRIIADARLEAERQQQAAKHDRLKAKADREQADTAMKALDLKQAQLERETTQNESALALRQKDLEARERKLASEAAQSRAVQVGLDAWLNGDIRDVGRDENGGRVIFWRDSHTMKRIRPIILPAISEVWEGISKLASQVKSKAVVIEDAAKKEAQKLIAGVSSAVSSYLDRFASSSEPEKNIARGTSEHSEVKKFLQDPSIKSAVAEGEEDEISDLLRHAFASGVLKKSGGEMGS